MKHSLRIESCNAKLCSNESLATGDNGKVVKWGAILLTAATLLVACQPLTVSGPTTPRDVVNVPTITSQLAELPVKGRAAKTGYQRSQFGPAWKDMDGNHCDTRNDILARDLDAQKVDNHCRVLRGQLTDPYTGRVIAFTRGERTSSAVQIDHVVALGNAWVTGAQQLTETQREQLANDPLNLLAVDGPTNEAKSDADAATWLPPRKNGRCSYVARQITVKARYQLWVTAAERDAMTRVLTSCPTTATR